MVKEGDGQNLAPYVAWAMGTARWDDAGNIFFIGFQVVVIIEVVIAGAFRLGRAWERRQKAAGSATGKKKAVIGDVVFRTARSNNRVDARTHLYEDCQALVDKEVLHHQLCAYCLQRSQAEARGRPG